MEYGTIIVVIGSRWGAADADLANMKRTLEELMHCDMDVENYFED